MFSHQEAYLLTPYPAPSHHTRHRGFFCVGEARALTCVLHTVCPVAVDIRMTPSHRLSQPAYLLSNGLAEGPTWPPSWSSCLLEPQATFFFFFFVKRSRGSGQKHGVSDCLILYRDKESQSHCLGWKIARVAVL